MVPQLYRRRFIPEELTHLKNDEILAYTEEIIITKWKTLKPRNDFAYGFSCYYVKEGYKISQFYTEENQLLYTYCDMISVVYDKEANKITCNDLLIDVIIYPDGFVKVLDLYEIVEGLDKGLITSYMMKTALRSVDTLLDIIYKGELDRLITPLKPYLPK